MNANERRKVILEGLSQSSGPVSAGVLAQRLSVSRQVVVGDVALLRASGHEITATARGYLLERPVSEGVIRQVACRHSSAEMEAELTAMVDQGCTVLDVVVNHPIYGPLTGPLSLSNRYEVGQFLARCVRLGAIPVSHLTGGIHLHTLRCPDEEAYRRVLTALWELGILLEE